MPGDSTVDPMVEVQVLKEKKYTKAKEKMGATGLATWNEHLFFEPRNLVSINLYTKFFIFAKCLTICIDCCRY